MNFKRWIAFIAFYCLCTVSAHAKVPLFFNTGDELFEVAPYPEEIIQKYPEAKNSKAGYKCDHFGIFWADVWTWNCKLVDVVNENSYAELPSDVTAKLSSDPKYSLSNAKRNFWNHYGFATVIAALVAFSLFKLFMRTRTR